MLKNAEWEAVRDLLAERAAPAVTEDVVLDECAGRVLGYDLKAEEAVPPFDRSAYDGYALRAEDVRTASGENPVTLQITETIPAGETARRSVEAGYAAHLMTGAAIPSGADCVINFERTEYTENTVTLFAPLREGENIVRRGEDVQKGEVLAAAGTMIDAGLAGTLAAQGRGRVTVFRKPAVGIISTGNELVTPGMEQTEGKIRDANGPAFTALLAGEGCQVQNLGVCGDDAAEIERQIRLGLDTCDALLLTGGVSVGDWDVTPEAMERCGVKMLVRGVNMKPGMACAFGEKDGKLIFGLSGNPASALTNYYACVMPAIRKLTGRRDLIPERMIMHLKEDVKKKSPSVRFLRGRLDLKDGLVGFVPSFGQGNVMLADMIGCNAFAVIPAGSGALPAGTRVTGFQV